MRRKIWIRVYSSNAYRMKSPNAAKRPIPSRKRRKMIGNAIPTVSRPFKKNQMNSSANWNNCLTRSKNSIRKTKRLKIKTLLRNMMNCVSRNCFQKTI